MLDHVQLTERNLYEKTRFLYKRGREHTLTVEFAPGRFMTPTSLVPPQYRSGSTSHVTKRIRSWISVPGLDQSSLPPFTSQRHIRASPLLQLYQRRCTPGRLGTNVQRLLQSHSFSSHGVRE